MRQNAWLDDEVEVMCATTAFGMGIDKANVRFVLHHTMPMSMVDFQQESGRAGRDGMPALSQIFYDYSDVKRLLKLIDLNPCSNVDTKKKQRHSVNEFASFCENTTDCRKTCLLDHFNESTKDCELETVCDNCEFRGNSDCNMKNATRVAIAIGKAVEQFKKDNKRITLLQMADFLSGKVVKSLKGYTSVHFSSLKKCPITEIKQILRKMVLGHVLSEITIRTSARYYAQYLDIGTKFHDFMNGHILIHIKTDSRTDTVDSADVVVQSNVNVQNAALETECCNALLAEFDQIFANNVIRQIARQLPVTKQEILTIDGVTQEAVDQYAERLFRIVWPFAMEKILLIDDSNDESSDGDNKRPSGSFDDDGAAKRRKKN